MLLYSPTLSFSMSLCLYVSFYFFSIFFYYVHAPFPLFPSPCFLASLDINVSMCPEGIIVLNLSSVQDTYKGINLNITTLIEAKICFFCLV